MSAENGFRPEGAEDFRIEQAPTVPEMSEEQVRADIINREPDMAQVFDNPKLTRNELEIALDKYKSKSVAHKTTGGSTNSTVFQLANNLELVAYWDTLGNMTLGYSDKSATGGR